MAKKLSVKKISEITGFSPATVSNALNRKPGVRKETAEAILKTALEMGYTAGNATLSRIRFVIYRKDGRIIDNSNFHNFVMEGVSAEASENGLDTLILQLNYGSPSFHDQLELIKNDPECGVVLLATEIDQDQYKFFEDSQSPIVLLDGWSQDSGFDSVSIANIDSGFNAVRYLTERGHQRIGHVRGSFQIKAFQDRQLGYQKGLSYYRLPGQTQWEYWVGTSSQEAQMDMEKQLDERPLDVTALFVDDDRMAYGVMQALQRKGYKVPEDISVIGFDDLPFSSMTNPPLTTVHVYKQEMGRAAVRRLISIMSEDRQECRQKIEISTRIVERDSVRDLNS